MNRLWKAGVWRLDDKAQTAEVGEVCVGQSTAYSESANTSQQL